MRQLKVKYQLQHINQDLAKVSDLFLKIIKISINSY